MEAATPNGKEEESMEVTASPQRLKRKINEHHIHLDLQQNTSEHSNNSRHRSNNLYSYVRNNEFTNDFSKSRRIHIYDVAGQEALVRRFELTKVLKKHTGCVNTVNWSDCGDLLVSGSDDTRVCIWDYRSQKLRGSFESEHTANIFSTKFMPATNNEVVISCAGDCEVKAFNVNYTQSDQCGKLLVSYRSHLNRVKKLATDPMNSHTFVSASEDATIRQFDLRAPESTVLVDMNSSRGDIEMYSIAVNQLDPNYFVTGGCDPIVRIYDRRMLNLSLPKMQKCVKRFSPTHISKGKINISRGHITGVAYSHDGTEVLASYSGENVYLFDVNDTKETERPDHPSLKRAKKPEEIPSSLTADEEKKLGNEAFIRLKFSKAAKHFTNAIEKDPNHPLYYSNRAACYLKLQKRRYLPQALADANKAIELDKTKKSFKPHYRKAKVLKAMGKLDEALVCAKDSLALATGDEEVEEELGVFIDEVQACIEAGVNTEEWSSDDEEEESEEEEEEEEHEDAEEGESSGEAVPDSSFAQTYSGHCNLRTVKEVNFFGPRSEFVMSGSDDGNIFIWNKKTAKLVQLLKGDSFVVNCLQGHPYDCVLATSGIENFVKLWTPTAERPLSMESLEKAERVSENNRQKVREQGRSTLMPLSFLRMLMMRNMGREEEAGEGENGESDDEPSCTTQ